jgi:hypothetical protein
MNEPQADLVDPIIYEEVRRFVPVASPGASIYWKNELAGGYRYVLGMLRWASHDDFGDPWTNLEWSESPLWVHEWRLFLRGVDAPAVTNPSAYSVERNILVFHTDANLVHEENAQMNPETVGNRRVVRVDSYSGNATYYSIRNDDSLSYMGFSHADLTGKRVQIVIWLGTENVITATDGLRVRLATEEIGDDFLEWRFGIDDGVVMDQWLFLDFDPNTRPVADSLGSTDLTDIDNWEVEVLKVEDEWGGQIMFRLAALRILG